METTKFIYSVFIAGLLFGAGICNGGEKNNAYLTKTIDSNTGSTSADINTFTAKHSVTVKDVAKGSKIVRMWLPVPQNDENQTIVGFKLAETPGKVSFSRDPEHDNMFAYCEVENPQKSSYTFGYSFTVTRKKQSLNNPHKTEIMPITDEHRLALEEYLGSNRYVIIDDFIRKKADELCGNGTDPVKQARAIYDWIICYGEYWKKDIKRFAPSGHGSTKYFCEVGTGNCADFHAAFLSLVRSRGIPARINFGSVFWKDKQGKDIDAGYHCWPEFYAPGHGWVVVDASQGDFEPEKEEFYFGNLETRRIVFTKGRDINLVPRQTNPDPLDYLDLAYAEIDGNVLSNNQAVRKLTYDLIN